MNSLVKSISLSFCLAVIPLLSIPAASATECESCKLRKQEICAKECQLVASEKSTACQASCVKEYCRHKCNLEELTVPEEIGCVPCLDQQFNLCQPACDKGTDRVVALCKLDCAKGRCKNKCREKASEVKN